MATLFWTLVSLLGCDYGPTTTPVDGIDPDHPHLSVEEQRLQRFWHDYYDALKHYYGALDKVDWVAYYKNHGCQINAPCGPGGCQRIQFKPVFVSPQMQWAVPGLPLEAQGPPAAAPGIPGWWPEPVPGCPPAPQPGLSAIPGCVSAPAAAGTAAPHFTHQAPHYFPPTVPCPLSRELSDLEAAARRQAVPVAGHLIKASAQQPTASCTPSHELIQQYVEILDATSSTETFMAAVAVLQEMGASARSAIPAILKNAERLEIFRSNAPSRRAQDKNELAQAVTRAVVAMQRGETRKK